MAKNVISAKLELLLDVFCIVVLVPIVISSCVPSKVPVLAGLLVFVCVFKETNVYLKINLVLPPLTCCKAVKLEPVRGGIKPEIPNKALTSSIVPTVLPPIKVPLEL